MGAGVLSERVHARLRRRTSDEFSGWISRFVPALGREPKTIPCRVPDGRARNLAALRGTEVSRAAPFVAGIDPPAGTRAGRRLRREWQRNHGGPAVSAPGDAGSRPP